MGKSFVRVISITLVVLIVTASVLSLVFLDEIREGLTSTTERFGQIGVFVSIFILEVIPQPLTPDFIILTAFLIGLSPIETTIVALVATVASSIVGFEIGKKYGVDEVNKVSWERSRKFIDLAKKHGKWALLLAAVAPIPYIPMVIGALDFQRGVFLIYGMVPRLVSIVVRAYVLYLIIY